LSFDHDPEVCLKDILFNVSRIERYMVGVSREGFAGNDLVVDAVERCLQRICEAVYRLGERATELLADQPSAQIRALGNRLRHAYDAIDLAVIWETATNDLPPLKADAERALATLRSPGSSSS
jgi:uncharacterized protein with HEPN domain